MFALKLLLSPLLIGAVSLAGRRWGPSVSGWLVGLPLTSGPVVFLLALNQGTTFAARASQGTLLGLISVASFCLAYSWCSFRLNWLGSLLLGWCAFFLSTTFLLHVSAPLLLTFTVVVAFTVLVLALFPRSRKQSHAMVAPTWETPLRMVMAACTGYLRYLFQKRINYDSNLCFSLLQCQAGGDKISRIISSLLVLEQICQVASTPSQEMSVGCKM